MGAMSNGQAVVITLVESVYLIFMFFLYKTRYTLSSARYDQSTQQLGWLFVHDTGNYENKVCLFGKIAALIVLVGAWVRLRWATADAVDGRWRTAMQWATLLCSTVGAGAAYHMNRTVFVYLLPLLVVESYWLWMLECMG